MTGIIAQNTLDNSGLIKSPAGGGAWNFISKQTASGSATISFTSGIDSTYKEYFFTFKNIHPETANADFMFQANVAGGSGYNETITSSMFQAYIKEDNSASDLAYEDGDDLSQSTAFQQLIKNCGAEADDGGAGYLHLFNPSDTTFTTHFMAHSGAHENTGDYYSSTYTQGYFNLTGAIDDIQFKMSTGDIDAGDICLYGIST